MQFERGKIAYMLTATLTRPTTISPTTTRSTKLKFQDHIDIEAMYTPKTRTISLEPVHKRGKVKSVKPASSVTTHTTQTTSSAGRLTRNNTQNSTATRSTNSVCNPPLSPAPSDDTVHSNTTATSTQSFQVIDAESAATKRSPHTSDSRSNTTSSSAHTITATTELPRHGALPGDTVPIRVTITHTKADVRGMVIATLYRQGRVDMHPAIPLATRGKEKKAEYEDVYPKSRTGLGGLYFANGSPSSVFRKDLAQSSTMMVVNPQTMTADISTTVRIPDTAFPTIANVLGGMISFTYHVEVVVDLFGRLNETRILPRLTSSGPTFTHSMAGGNQLTSDWSHNILDTTQLRRTKSVITFEMSLVVGTVDSGRKQRQAKQLEAQNPNPEMQWGEEDWDDGNHYEYDGQYYDENGYQYYDEHGSEPHYYADHQNQTTEIIPPPQEVHEEMDEKARLRRQEQLLLPSQPPQEGESSNSAGLYAPTAPLIQSEHLPEGLRTHNDGSATPSSVHPASVASARSGETIRPYSASPPPGPPPFSEHEATDDKHELERRRLLAQASAPPTEDGGEASSSSGATPRATAPMINEEDEYNVQTLHHDHLGTDLPQYER